MDTASSILDSHCCNFVARSDVTRDEGFLFWSCTGYLQIHGACHLVPPIFCCRRLPMAQVQERRESQYRNSSLIHVSARGCGGMRACPCPLVCRCHSPLEVELCRGSVDPLQCLSVCLAYEKIHFLRASQLRPSSTFRAGRTQIAALRSRCSQCFFTAPPCCGFLSDGFCC